MRRNVTQKVIERVRICVSCNHIPRTYQRKARLAPSMKTPYSRFLSLPARQVSSYYPFLVYTQICHEYLGSLFKPGLAAWTRKPQVLGHVGQLVHLSVRRDLQRLDSRTRIEYHRACLGRRPRWRRWYCRSSSPGQRARSGALLSRQRGGLGRLRGREPAASARGSLSMHWCTGVSVIVVASTIWKLTL